MLPRPRIRIPLWLAVAIVVAIYVVRSAVRGFDFRPDLPADAVIFVLFVIVLAVVAYVRHRRRRRVTGWVPQSARTRLADDGVS